MVVYDKQYHIWCYEELLENCKRMTSSSTLNQYVEIDGVIGDGITEFFVHTYRIINNNHHVN